MKKKWEKKKIEVAYEVKYKQKPISWETAMHTRYNVKLKIAGFFKLEEFLSQVYHFFRTWV